MPFYNFERIKSAIIERININYSKSLEFYSGFIVAFYLENVINMDELKELRKWLNSCKDLR